MSVILKNGIALDKGSIRVERVVGLGGLVCQIYRALLGVATEINMDRSDLLSSRIQRKVGSFVWLMDEEFCFHVRAWR